MEQSKERNMLGAIIQARMGSTRLPGKIMMEVLGKPILWHVVNRLKHSKRIEKIIIATTENVLDRKIVEFSDKNRIDFFCGSEEDVLDRYYHASIKFNLKHIVRITSDCPMIDPRITDKVIEKYMNKLGEVDYASNMQPPTYPDGLDTEVFSFAVLETAWKEAKKKYQREHVTPFIWEQPDKFKLINVENNEDLSFMRWTVDEENDFIFVEKVFCELYPKKEIFLMNDVTDLLKRKPELTKINKGIIRNEGFIKSLMEGGES